MKARTLVAPFALAGAVLAASVAVAPSANAQNCSHTVGAVLSLTGSYGAFGVPISRAAQLGVEQVNEARANVGVGCVIKYDVRDSQTQPSVAVDAAQKLIDIDGVTSIVGPISSGITGPLLTSVTVDKGVVMIVTASTSSTFTQMSREGKTKGLFFRTLPADSLQAVATAKMAHDAGFRKVAIIHLNNDWGKNNQSEFINAFKALGGDIANVVSFNPDQPSYRSEVNKAMEGNPDALYLLSQPQDGAKQMRDWIGFGGPKGFVFPQGMNDPAFVGVVGEEAIQNGWFISPASPKTPSFQTVNADIQACCDLTIDGGPGRTSGYDSGALLALANVAADIKGIEATGANLAKLVREITGPQGEVVHAGVKGFEAAIKLLQQGKDIAYVGVTGPIQFDKYGDVSGAFSAQQYRDGAFKEMKSISLEDVNKVIGMVQGR
ncbi:MAG: ABC transporter substrate-binding protein [Proteobacteria bacterium]|nr:ABC transporter substrate-binding protein [Pseudomonadota bacterium]